MYVDYPTWLPNELKNDPANLGYNKYVLEGADGIIEQIGNNQNPSFSVYFPIPVSTLLKWAAQGPFQTINDYAQNTTNNATLRSVCFSALHLFGSVSTLDITDPQINGASGLLQLLEANSLITGASLQSLLSYGTKQPCSRFEVLGGAGTYINHLQVATALGRFQNKE